MIFKSSFTQNDMILLSAMELSDGDINKKFTAEELLIRTWHNNKNTFGLKGFEEKYPDSNMLYTKLMGKSGLIRKGLIKKVGEKTYTITEAGFSIASTLKPMDNDVKVKARRQLNEAIVKIINHPVFMDWIKSNGKEPTKFRDAMWFWGIAPGVPSKIAKERIKIIEQNLNEAKNKVEGSGGKIAVDIRGISKDTKDYYSEYDYKKGQLNLNSIEINRCIEFQNELKRRFQNELLFILRDN